MSTPTKTLFLELWYLTGLIYFQYLFFLKSIKLSFVVDLPNRHLDLGFKSNIQCTFPGGNKSINRLSGIYSEDASTMQC